MDLTKLMITVAYARGVHKLPFSLAKIEEITDEMCKLYSPHNLEMMLDDENWAQHRDDLLETVLANM